MSQGLSWSSNGFDSGPSAGSAEIPGLYNSAGLQRFFLQRANCGMNADGTGMGGTAVIPVGDSFFKGYNQTNPIRDNFNMQVHRAFAALPWCVGSGKGRGFVSGRSGSVAWPAGSATLSGQGIWTFDSNWTTGAAASINNLRSTGGAGAQVRIFIDPRDDPQWLEGVTDIAICHGKEAVAGTLTFDLKYASSDTGFFTAGTGDITGTIDMNAATQGGVFTWPAGLSGLDPSQPFILQISRTAGTIYFEGAYFCCNDKTSGLHWIDSSRIGAATGDATFTNADRLAATITKRCTYGSTIDSRAGLVLFGFGINDCNQELGTSSFQTRIAALTEFVNTVSSGQCAVGYFIHGCLDEALYAKNPPFDHYKSALGELCDTYRSYSAVLSFDDYMRDPDTAAEVNVFEADPFAYSTDADKHPKNRMVNAMQAFILDVCGMTMPC